MTVFSLLQSTKRHKDFFFSKHGPQDCVSYIFVVTYCSDLQNNQTLLYAAI